MVSYLIYKKHVILRNFLLTRDDMFFLEKSCILGMQFNF